jgi:hypothetical protein
LYSGVGQHVTAVDSKKARNQDVGPKEKVAIVTGGAQGIGESSAVTGVSIPVDGEWCAW